MLLSKCYILVVKYEKVEGIIAFLLNDFRKRAWMMRVGKDKLKGQLQSK